MTRHRRRAALAGLIGLLLGALGAGPVAAAPAGEPVERGTGWTMAPCVEPKFDTIAADRSVHMLVLTGVAEQCPPIVAGSGFRLASYHPGADRGMADRGVAEGYNIRLFPTFYPGRVPVRRFGTAVLPAEPGEYGVCLLAAADQRVLCTLVVVTHTVTGDVEARMLPLAVTDRLVAKEVDAGPYTGALGPPGDLGGSCGTCF